MEKYTGQERRKSSLEVDIRTIVSLIDASLGTKFEGNQRYQDLKFDGMEKKIDSFIADAQCKDVENKKVLFDAIKERKEDFEFLKTEIFTKVDVLEGNIKVVESRVDTLEQKDAKTALDQKRMLKDEIIKWIIVGGIGAAFIILLRWAITGTLTIV